MSQWDYGDGREPAEHPEADYPQEPRYGYPRQPQVPQYPPAALPPDPYAQRPPDGYRPPPIPYGMQPGQQPGATYPPDSASWSDDEGWPEDGYPGANDRYDRPVAYPITYERDGFDGRTALPPALPPGPASAYESWPNAAGPAYRFDVAPPPPPPAPSPYTTWPDGADPAARFGAEPSPGGWRPPPPPPPPGPPPPYAPRPDAADPGSRFGAEPSPGRWRPPPPPPQDLSGSGWRQPWSPGPPPLRDDPGFPGQDGPGGWADGAERWPNDDGEWFDERPTRGRWLIPAAVAVAGAAVGVAIVMVTLGHSHGAASHAGTPAPTSSTVPTVGGTSARTAGAAAATGPGTGSPPLTLTAARGVLSAYTAANNRANATRSAATLATVETGGSYAIDAGVYTIEAVTGATPFPAFAPATATYYIPQAEAPDGPRWFVVRVANAFTADPGKVTSTEYLLFTETTAGAWQNAVEPYLLTGTDAPQVAVGDDGLATAVDTATTSLAVAPGRLAEQTAAALDGPGAGAASGAGVVVADAAALADRSNLASWRSALPTATITDAHAPAAGSAGQTFALRTTDGGALVFYTDAADLTITAAPGSALHLTVPGFYSPGPALTRAGLSYLDQFAAVDPAAGAGAPHVIAQYSGITGKA